MPIRWPGRTLNIPANSVMVLMIGALIIQGITPGPNVATDQPALFLGVIVAMGIGNLMLVLLNLPLIGIWVRLRKIPYYVLSQRSSPSVRLACTASTRTPSICSPVAVFGLLGYVLVKLECEPAPLLPGFILGPTLEEHLRRAMIISRGDPAIFFVTRPLSGACWRSPSLFS